MQAGSKGLNDLRGYESSPINTKGVIYRRNSPISNKKGNGEGREQGRKYEIRMRFAHLFEEKKEEDASGRINDRLFFTIFPNDASVESSVARTFSYHAVQHARSFYSAI